MRRAWIFAFFWLSGGSGTAAWADGDHERARRAVEEGRILPLREILLRAEAECPGQMIATELEEEGGVMVYELKILTDEGRVVKMWYDARSGTSLRSRCRGRRP